MQTLTVFAANFYPMIIFTAIAVFRAYKNKKPWTWLILGAVVQLYFIINDAVKTGASPMSGLLIFAVLACVSVSAVTLVNKKRRK